MPDQDLTSELVWAKQEISALHRRIELLEQKLEAIPRTLLLSKSQTMRSLAVLGHVFLGSLAVYIVVLSFGLLTGQID